MQCSRALTYEQVGITAQPQHVAGEQYSMFHLCTSHHLHHLFTVGPDLSQACPTKVLGRYIFIITSPPTTSHSSSSHLFFHE